MADSMAPAIILNERHIKFVLTLTSAKFQYDWLPNYGRQYGAGYYFERALAYR